MQKIDPEREAQNLFLLSVRHSFNYSILFINHVILNEDTITMGNTNCIFKLSPSNVNLKVEKRLTTLLDNNCKPVAK